MKFNIVTQNNQNLLNEIIFYSDSFTWTKTNKLIYLLTSILLTPTNTPSQAKTSKNTNTNTDVFSSSSFL